MAQAKSLASQSIQTPILHCQAIPYGCWIEDLGGGVHSTPPIQPNVSLVLTYLVEPPAGNIKQIRHLSELDPLYEYSLSNRLWGNVIYEDTC